MNFGSSSKCALRGLTFELRRDRRYCAWPARRIMYQGASRAKCNAVGPRLERGVRQRVRWHEQSSDDGSLTWATTDDRPSAWRTPRRRQCLEGRQGVGGDEGPTSGTAAAPNPLVLRDRAGATLRPDSDVRVLVGGRLIGLLLRRACGERDHHRCACSVDRLA